MDVIDMKTAGKLLEMTPRQASLLVDGGKIRGWKIPGSFERRTTIDEIVRYRRTHCEHCMTRIIDDCQVCGAPQCCPKCCRETTQAR